MTDDRKKKPCTARVKVDTGNMRWQIEELFPNGVPPGTTVKICLPDRKVLNEKKR